jgi:tetratricopeptide (TPR) repeat protein
MPLSPELQEAVDTAKAGQLAEARSMLKQILRKDPTNEMAWFVFSQIAESRANAIVCLQKVLAINPYNERARKMLDQMQPKEEPKPDSTQPWDYNNYVEQQEKSKGTTKKKGINRNIVFGIGGLVIIGLLLAAGFYFAPSLFPAKPTIAPIKAVIVWTPTIDLCNCDEARPYAERSVLRFGEMVDEMDAIGDGLNDNSLSYETVVVTGAKAQGRYDDQRKETPPPCLEQFDIKMVGIFWNWQQALASLQQGDNNAVLAFVNDIVRQSNDIDRMLDQLDLQLKGCPIPRPTPPGRTG